MFYYKAIFRTKLAADLLVLWPPMKVPRKSDAQPMRTKLCKYSPDHATFLLAKVEELERLRFVRFSNNSYWACAALAVPKLGPKKLRLTIGLRPVNAQTVRISWPMPNDVGALHLAGSTCFAQIDLFHGSLQLSLDEESQEFQSFITPDGVYTPNRILQGQTNAAPFFQSFIQQICKPFRENLFQWLMKFCCIAKQ